MRSGIYITLFVVITCIGFCVTTPAAGITLDGSAEESPGDEGGLTQFSINATAGELGNISPSGDVMVAEGDDVTFTLTPDPADLNCWGAGTRYVVWDLTVDGDPVDIGPGPSILPVEYTFEDVQSDHTLHANFAEMIIDARPFAKFSANVTSGPAPLAVNFSQVLVSGHTRLLWSFGDNTTSTEEAPSHTYTRDGRYTVSLTIWCDEDESSTEEKPEYISVGSGPVANFAMNNTMGMRPLSVQFTDMSSGTLPMAYNWTFGDNTTSNEQNPVHTYTGYGCYQVNLTVSNAWGISTKPADQPIIIMRPIGGDKGYFLVHCNVDGAAVFFDQSYKGLIENGSLLVSVYITAAPYRTYTVDKEGYQPFSATLPRYPGRDQTVGIDVTLVPADGTISGFVASGSDFGSFMVPGARVVVSPSIPFHTVPFTREAVTDARGMYRLSGLPTGITLYATVLSPVTMPNGYYERPIQYQVNEGRIITCDNSSIYPAVPALVSSQKTRVNFFVRQNPAVIPGGVFSL